MAEPLVIGWIDAYRDRSRVMVDLGANVGVYTVQAAQHFSRVYSFEPHPEIFRTLADNTGALLNVTRINKAIEWPGPMSSPMPTPQVMSLDQLWRGIREKGETIGLIKCDVEGAEDYIWDNSVTLLKENREWLWIILELHDGVNFARLYDLFLDHGYGWSDDNLYHAGHYLIKKPPRRGC